MPDFIMQLAKEDANNIGAMVNSFKHMLEVSKILNRLKEQGRTVITVTHDSEFIENCCDEIIDLSEESYKLNL